MLINPIDKIKYPNVYSGYQYAIDVSEGLIPNSKFVIGSCNRFLKEYAECLPEDSKYIFDIDYVERYLRLVQNFEHVIGTWETLNIVYNPWQKWIWSAALGFKFRSNKSQPKFRTLHIEVPRGCAKSTMASQCALYFLGLDPNRVGEKLAVFATKNEQARIILDASRAMAQKSPKYLKATGVEVQMHKIIDPKTFSEMVAMSADSKSMDGLNLRIAFCDELHAMTRELFEVITSGMKKRRDSIVIALTTAGFSTDGIGHSQSQYAKKVCLGEVDDPAFFAVVYTIDDGDDIYSEDTWKKANPNYGYSVDPVAFTSTAEKVKVTPSDKPNFLVKSLNVWISEANAFYEMGKWKDCFNPNLDINNFLNKKCYGAIDLASKVDLTAKILVFRENGKYSIFQKAYLPEETFREENNILYDNAKGKGELEVTPGEAINYQVVERDILEDNKKFSVLGINFDPWNATQCAQNLLKERINMVEFRMTTANLSEPMKILDALMRQGKLEHNGGELLSWCISNIVAKPDQNGNVFPRKSSDKLKIDLAIVLLMAIASWIQEKEVTSVYETRGLIHF